MALRMGIKIKCEQRIINRIAMKLVEVGIPMGSFS